MESNKRSLYDFYSRPEGIHFAQELMTASEALAYARKYQLEFERA